MITASQNVINALSSSVRQIKARVELYNGSTLVDTFSYNDRLISFTIDRLGEENKFFGFGVFQKINIKLIDLNREINITTQNHFKVIYTIDNEDVITHPIFYVSEVHRDEENNELSITAYDALYEASQIPLSDTDLKDGEYSFSELFYNISRFLQVAEEIAVDNNISSLSYWQGVIVCAGYGNFEETNNLKEVLDDIAEALQAIYFIDHQNKLHIARLNPGAESLKIDKSKQIDLKSGENRRLGVITSATELGNNITVSTEESGSTQYIRDNEFFIEDSNAETYLNNGIEYYKGISINQFECEWRGNPLSQILERLEITTKDNKKVYSFLINDTINYNGAFSQNTQWNYENNEEETASNSTNLGEVLKQTFAKVDKANKKITLLASEAEANKKEIAQLVIDTEGITTSIESNEKAIDDLTGDISDVKSEVSTKMTSDSVQIAINKALENGVNKVSTSTGFTFDDTGLTISKSDSEMSTLIDDDGMKVSKNEEEVLTADNTGVNAINLTARQYLIIGTNSRFEDYGDNRTGCFWIGS